jgi:hypothetical protein
MYHAALAADPRSGIEEAPLELAVIIPTFNEAASSATTWRR